MAKTSQLKRFFLRLLITVAVSAPFALALLVYHFMVSVDLEDCNAAITQAISYVIRIVLNWLGFMLVFAYLDKLCLKANQYDEAPTIDNINYQNDILLDRNLASKEHSTRTLDHRGSLLSRTNCTNEHVLSFSQ